MANSSSSQRMWGRFEHSLDDKGRVIVPQKFREKLGDEIVLTIGPDHHIRAYPLTRWEQMEEQLVTDDLMDELDPDMIFLQRMFGSCEFVAPDTQNRISLPRHLRDWADLRESEGAIIIGNGNRVEFWNRNLWGKISGEFTGRQAAEAAGRRKVVGLGMSLTATPVDSNGKTEPGDAADGAA